MPLKEYGVLKGKALAVMAESEAGTETPHYQIHMTAAGGDYRIAVNVKSKEEPSELLYLIEDDLRHPLTSGLPGLAEGFQALDSRPGGLALDYIRGNLFERSQLRPVPFKVAASDNDLSEILDHYVQRARKAADARLFAFGERWGPEEDKEDKIFHFEPGNGVHDIHMNQGNVGGFVKDDGVWQDGGLLIHLPSENRFVGIFLAFQSQAWHTDDQTGHTIFAPAEPGAPARPAETEAAVRIVAALVNPIGPAPEAETVTLINVSPAAVNLAGWALADRHKNKHVLSGALASGSAVVVPLPQQVQLGNKGGIITLLDPQGLKVHGVSYTEEEARREGWTVVFGGSS